MMKKLIKHARNILAGKEQMTDKQKFDFIISSITGVHFILIFVFLYLDIRQLCFFNVVSVLSYLFSFYWIHKGNYLPAYYIAYTEIILNTLVSTLCIGWQFGFAQYIFAVIPVGYYICYTTSTLRHKLSTATISALTADAAFLGCKALSLRFEPLYRIDSDMTEMFLYGFNSLCTFAFLIVFSYIFILEISFTHSRLRHQNTILNQLANTDPLTGLYNRRSMNLFMEQALESKFAFSLIMCDIDDFKQINDKHGHDFGDIVLKGISKIVVEQVKEHGYVCRWGGEEILILINSCSREKTLQIAENIRRLVDHHVFELNSKWIHCTLTLGIAIYEDGKTIEETITAADYNLYRGKRNGKNKVVI